jgi:predicted negative regulator of RcsB-dependent stress response
MEEYTPESQEEKSEQLKRWFQDNLRILISVAIVIVIAGGIYSYSKRTDSPIVTDQSQSTDSEVAVDENQADTVKTDQVAVTDNKNVKQEVSSTATSKETESSFVETAAKSDGLTVLARKATANYLEKNQDSALTKEHKIYIEDYLRKNIGHKGGVHVGTSVEFSKDLIAKAIAQSKTLNEKQLKNLQKYSARVSSLN